MQENEFILLAIIKINIEPLLTTTTNLLNITIDTELKVTSETIPSQNICLLWLICCFEYHLIKMCDTIQTEPQESTKLGYHSNAPGNTTYPCWNSSYAHAQRHKILAISFHTGSTLSISKQCVISSKDPASMYAL